MGLNGLHSWKEGGQTTTKMPHPINIRHCSRKKKLLLQNIYSYTWTLPILHGGGAPRVLTIRIKVPRSGDPHLDSQTEEPATLGKGRGE
jgi:hypothetical protein